MGKEHFGHKPVFCKRKKKIFVVWVGTSLWLRTQEAPITGSLGGRQKCQRADGKQAFRGCLQTCSDGAGLEWEAGDVYHLGPDRVFQRAPGSAPGVWWWSGVSGGRCEGRKMCFSPAPPRGVAYYSRHIDFLHVLTQGWKASGRERQTLWTRRKIQPARLSDFTPDQEQISEEDTDHTKATEDEPFQRPCLLIGLHVGHPEPEVSRHHHF